MLFQTQLLDGQTQTMQPDLAESLGLADGWEVTNIGDLRAAPGSECYWGD